MLIHKGEILLYEDRDTLLEKYALIRCNAEEAAKLNPAIVVGVRRGRFDTEVLVRSREGLEANEHLAMDRASLEDILLYTAGEPGNERCAG